MTAKEADMTTLATHRRPTAPCHRGLAAFSGAVAVSAWGGVVGLVGGGIQFPDHLVERLPFDSPAFGGVALGAVVAVPTTAAAVLAWRGSTWTGAATQVAGAATIGWIVVQMGFLRELSFFHPLYLGIGTALVAAGRRAARQDAVDVGVVTDGARRTAAAAG
ncbi:hypothetical protein [Thalassiella azotivora]